ncbi:MAG: glycosyltransferase [Rhodovulum sp.]
MSCSGLSIFVFSYNRGVFLKNCLNSVFECNEGKFPVFVIDDNSNDPEVNSALKDAVSEFGVEVVKNNRNDREFKTGGLCGSMNTAMKIAQEQRCKYALFIQDDMQFLRGVETKDVENFGSYFAANPQSLQLTLCFFPRLGHLERGGEVVLDPSKVAWRRLPKYEGGKSHFSDVGLFHVERFFQYLGRFEPGEEVNSARCADAGLYRGLYRAPIMHWLPFPKSFRGGKRSLLHSFLEDLCGAGFHPYLPCGVTKRELVMREWSDPQIVAESALISPTAPESKFWSVTGGVSQVYARGGWRLFLFRIFQLFRRGFWR